MLSTWAVSPSASSTLALQSRPSSPVSSCPAAPVAPHRITTETYPIVRRNILIPFLQFQVKTADWIVDLGPEGGEEGGRIVVEGPPERVAEDPASHTGRFLREMLERGAGVSAG